MQAVTARKGGRQRISNIRRRELAEATLLTLQAHGFQGTTVQRVSEQAGMSPGLVHHYFRTKDDMLEAAIRLTNARITEAVIARLHRSKTPRERLVAVIEGNFAPDIFDQGVVQAWASCCGAAAFDARFARVLHMIQRRLRSNLIHSLRSLLAPDHAEIVADGLVAMIDGTWLGCALASGPLDRTKALRPIWRYLDASLRDAE